MGLWQDNLCLLVAIAPVQEPNIGSQSSNRLHALWDGDSRRSEPSGRSASGLFCLETVKVLAKGFAN